MTMHIQYKRNLSKVAEEEYKKTHTYQKEKKKHNTKQPTPKASPLMGHLHKTHCSYKALAQCAYKFWTPLHSWL